MDDANLNMIYPQTRYQGSKQKLIEWIGKCISHLEFNSVLDAFGGTGVVSHYMKLIGKQVFYNDLLKFNYYIGLALIENDSVLLSDKDINFILKKHKSITYPTFIQDTFKDIYYTDDENVWLDMVVTNIQELDNIYKRALAYFALFQSCIIKRPYNLFHRKNLYVRIAEVKRSFGNKTTWDKPFPYYFKKFARDANMTVFSNGYKNLAYNYDVMFFPGPDNNYDLVYIDTPYISANGVGVDYYQFYHFLEGLVDYDNWHKKIDYSSKHLRLKPKKSVWTDKKRIYYAFDKLFKKYRDSILVVSYRSDGIPKKQDLFKLLEKHKNEVEVKTTNHKYVLSNKSTVKELLFIGV